MTLLSSIDPALLGWSRAQFALTAGYHWIFVPLTLGLAVIMAVIETMYYRTGDEFWKKTAQFWQKLFGINFAIGVATGIILEFQFGTNWSNYSWFVGDIFGAPLAIEGIFAFFMEATFVAVMFFGWGKVSKGFHLASTWLTGIGATLSAWWILVANSWMQHPVGMNFNPDTVRNEMMDFFAVAFQPHAVMKFCHTVSSGWLTGAMFVIAVSSWFLLRKRNIQMATKSIKVASIVGFIAAVIVAGTGDQSGVVMAKHQPMKLAAAEGLVDGQKGAALSIVPGVEVPGLLSLLANHDTKSFVPGINDILYKGYTNHIGDSIIPATVKMQHGQKALDAFKTYRSARENDPAKAAEARKVFEDNKAYFGYGYIEKVEDLVPNTTLVYWAFRAMVGAGMAMLLLTLLFWWFERKGSLLNNRWLLHAGVWGVALAYIAEQAGWIVAEVGRQPWAIQDLLPVNAAMSSLSVTNVQITFFLFVIVFTALLIAELRILFSAINKHEQE
ncbi:MAG: cytochrome ubiquinol oxidase subunit I [Bacteroidaceae bacterium]|nr:cytochrome ubiquinol oxidase subunit I [Bacteroidaceae bacterium]